MLGQCFSLTVLDLSRNGIGSRGAGRLAGVLGQCFSLTVLDLSRNGIGAQGVGRSAKVLGSAPDSPSCILMSIGLERMPLSCFGLALETALGFLYSSLARQRWRI